MRTAMVIAATFIASTIALGQDLPRPEQLQRFDPGRVEVTWSRDGWALTTPEGVLKNFGRRNTDAADAQRLIRDLGLTERGTIGGASTVLEYWLADGAAPTKSLRGHRVLPIDLASLRVETDGGQWCVRDAQRVLFNFGYGKEDAEQAVALVQKYRFTRILLLGQPAPTMTVFLAEPHEATLANRHTLRPASIPTAPLLRIDQAKDAKDADKGKLAGGPMQSYVPPAVPALRENPAVGMPAFGASVPVVPGVNDRLVRVGFDWRQAGVRRDPDGWVLHCGARVLARFGADAETARKALLAMQHYRFTEMIQVGSGQPVCQVFTVAGRPPLGELFGVASLPVTVDKVAVQAVEGRYALVQGGEALLALGDRAEDGLQLLDWMRRQKIDNLCRLPTTDGNGMVFFVKR